MSFFSWFSCCLSWDPGPWLLEIFCLLCRHLSSDQSHTCWASEMIGQTIFKISKHPTISKLFLFWDHWGGLGFGSFWFWFRFWLKCVGKEVQNRGTGWWIHSQIRLIRNKSKEASQLLVCRLGEHMTGAQVLSRPGLLQFENVRVLRGVREFGEMEKDWSILSQAFKPW